MSDFESFLAQEAYARPFVLIFGTFPLGVAQFGFSRVWFLAGEFGANSRGRKDGGAVGLQNSHIV